MPVEFTFSKSRAFLSAASAACASSMALVNVNPEASLYPLIIDTANEAVTEHIVERVPEVAMFGEPS